VTIPTAVDFTPQEFEGRAKLMGLDDAVERFVRPRDVVHIAYSDARPNAAIQQLARTFAGTSPRFTVVSAGLVNIQHALVELGLVEKVIVSFAGENYPVARPNPALVRAIADGTVRIEHWSLWALIARLTAGALGVSHFPVRSMRGSSMGEEAARRGELIELDGDTALVSALRPDVVLVHGAAADPHGNVVLAAPYGEGQAGALAARRGVIVTVERVVSTAQLRRMNTLTRIPAHVVRAVCLAPYGAHPYGFNNPGVPDVASYTEDDEFMAEALASARTPSGFRGFIEDWITAVPSHQAYLDKLGDDRLKSLIRTTRTPAPATETAPPDPASRLENQVVVTARRIEAAVRGAGHQALLAGVGLANLAAWIGARALREGGVDVELMAEIGLFGYCPLPGEPFIFAGQNVPTNKLLTDVMGVLGTYVPGPGTRSLGVVGAGQIDRSGAVNSTYGEDGRFLVGSGGANDVLSGADEVIVTVGHRPGRLVETVPYVTSPGHRVSTIVTDLCVLERDPAAGEFVLTTLLPGAGPDLAAGVAQARAATGWDLPVASEVHRAPSATPEELGVLRAFDPDGVFIRDRR
jgi:acyl CoA:acetate/3-ketoacid CoA transferase alpha subunit/acyl CoA:acetate/3-ketoacid CoA transferase beta subunit